MVVHVFLDKLSKSIQDVEANLSIVLRLRGVRSGMANIHLELHEAFEFREPNDSPRRKRCFNQFEVAARLAGEDKLRQVSTLLDCLGEEAGDVLATANLAEDARKEYAMVIKNLDDCTEGVHNCDKEPR